MPSKESERHVEAVIKALNILDCFRDSSRLGLNDLTRLTDMNKSRVLRLCGTLVHMGYLIHDESRSVYSLGPQLFFLGRLCEKSNILLGLGRPMLAKLVEKTGETCSLFIIDNDERLCLAREKGTYAVRHSIVEGYRSQLYAGAAGKVLLAYSTADFLEGFLKRCSLKDLTERTIIDKEQLNKELEVIRKQGWASSIGERDPDAAALSVPVFDHDGHVLASVGMVGPVSRFKGKNRRDYLETLIESGREFSRKLGYIEPESME